MSDFSLIRPGISRSFYPEKILPKEDWFEKTFSHGSRLKQRYIDSNKHHLQSFVDKVNNFYQLLDDTDLQEKIESIKKELILDFTNEKTIAETFAIIKKIAGCEIGMSHFDVQIMGGWIMLNGMLAEMQTGEGKTLTATLPACTAALAGIPVHIISVNDYLVTRDAELMKPIYDVLGLSVGTITADLNSEQRQAAYQCDITYCTSQQLIFDYLKDRLILKNNRQNLNQVRLERLYSSDPKSNKLLMRGLCFAIVDEADSILIDEARTPLILAKQGKEDYKIIIYRQALDLARQLIINKDFIVDQRQRHIELTSHGRIKLSQLAKTSSSFWKGKRRRTELVTQALTAEYLFLRDQQYLVRDDQVEIIDEHTGRSMPDRKWEGGLHQMIEIKEGCEPSPQNRTLARISNQLFFRRYLRLSAMTGTASDVANELWANYRLGVVPIPTHKPNIRIVSTPQFFRNPESKWKAIVTSIQQAKQRGQPVLIATKAVETSDYLSQLLTNAGLSHQILNARQDKEEADVIAKAGHTGQITVATNMAGRGTDIKLAPGVAEKGGLHVISCEPNASRRVDKQVIGRCARQGDPGSAEIFYSLEDDIIQIYRSKKINQLIPSFGWSIASRAQRSKEKHHKVLRQVLLKSEKRVGTLLAFSGSQD